MRAPIAERMRGMPSGSAYSRRMLPMEVQREGRVWSPRGHGSMCGGEESPFRRTGFTLVELLVVMAILSILASLLLPVLSKARNAAQDLACTNNHRQVGVGLQVYAGDCGGWLPPQHGYPFKVMSDSGPPPWGIGWLFKAGALPDEATSLLADPTYANPESTFWGPDGWINTYMRDVGQDGKGYAALGSYTQPPFSYSVCRWQVPDSWQDGATNWSSSSPSQRHSIRITDRYAMQYHPLRTACMWATNGAVGVPPDGSHWMNAYTHRAEGANMGFNDGSAQWVDGRRIIPHDPGPVVHWRDRFWRYGGQYK